MRLSDFEVSTFRGLNTAVKDTRTLAPGVAQDSLNWLTGRSGDHIELRRGSALLGETRVDGSGKVTGLGVGVKKDGSQVPFFSYGTKVKYYNDTTDDTVEVGSDILGAAADGDSAWFSAYTHLAGNFMYFGGKNISTHKIPVANPGSAVDQSSASRFGILRAGQGRAYAGQYRSSDGTKDEDINLYLSHIDKDNFSDYTRVTAEVVGALGSQTYSGTLAARSGARTVFLVTILESGGETFTDNGDGTLTGSAGGTGTINYATGAYSVTFHAVTSGAVTAEYYWEDATSGGVMDFSFSSPRTTGEGDLLLQSGSGPIKAIFPFLSYQFALHLLQTWQYTISLDDTEATNLPYRNIGIPSERGAAVTPDGILLIDNSNPSDPKVRRMQLEKGGDNTTIIPVPLSDALDLSGHAFDYAVVFRWGDYEILCCQDYTNANKNTYNSVMYVRNVVTKTWDKLEYFANCLAEYAGMLIAGDSISNNVFTLFSGYDDDGSPISNHWADGEQNLGTDNLKRVHRMVVPGLIQKNQKVKVYLKYDDGDYTEVFEIDGSADYVDQGINIAIGSNTIGSNVIGGGVQDTAHPFSVDFPVHSDLFQYVSVKFEAQDVGYVAINSYKYKDIRDKGRRSLSTKTVTN